VKKGTAVLQQQWRHSPKLTKCTPQVHHILAGYGIGGIVTQALPDEISYQTHATYLLISP
jgi:hypothetical protein